MSKSVLIEKNAATFEFITSNTGSNLEGEAEDLFIDLQKFPIPKIVVSKEDILANEERINSINVNEIPHD